MKGVNKNSKLKWSKWYALNSINQTPCPVPTTPGVYQIRWGINGHPQPIPRTNEPDEDGFLYIGKTVNLKRRIKTLRKGISQGVKTRSVTYSHTAAYTYTFYGFDRKINPSQLEVRWGKLPEDKISGWEQELLETYGAKYLDRPPLNISLRRR